MVGENKPTIPIWCLNVGDNFTLNGTNVKGELLSCPEYGDANVKLVKGTKIERQTWSRESLIVPISRSEAYVEVEVITPKSETINKMEKVEVDTRSGKDKYGCQISKTPGKINAAFSKEPQSIQQIAVKAGVTSDRVLNHITWWVNKKKGIGLYLEIKNGMYSLKS